MDKALRSILWVLVALVLLSSFSAGWFFVAKERLYDEYVSLETFFTTSMDRLNRELASSDKKNIEVSSKLEAVERQTIILESKHRDLEFQYKDVLKEKDELDEDLIRVKKAKFFLEKRLKEMDSEKFVAGLLKEKATIKVELKRLKNSLMPKDLEIEKLKQENMDLEIVLSKLMEGKTLFQEKLEDSASVAQILSMDLLREKNKNEKDRNKLENSKIENRVLKTRMAELEKSADEWGNFVVEREEMQLKISRLERGTRYKEEEIDRLQLAIERTRESRELRAEAYHAPSKVELPPIVLKGEDYRTSKLTTPSLERINSPSFLKGRIVTVNREHDFVVIDIGKQDGVALGSSFDVYRDDFIIGSVEVIQVRERIAAADIKDIKEGFYIEIDDVIVK